MCDLRIYTSIHSLRDLRTDILYYDDDDDDDDDDEEDNVRH